MTDKPKAAATPKPSGRFTESPMPLPVERALVAAGDDLALARRRRGLSTSSMAERAGISKRRSTGWNRATPECRGALWFGS